MSLPKHYNRVTWFGRGPGESYRDKKEAAQFGLWKASLNQLQTNYEWPQEHGNQSDVHWARFESEQDGLSLEARMETPFNFSLRKHSTADLDNAKHPHELTELGEIVLNLDYVQYGLGSSSCGPPPFPQYQLKANPFEFTTSLRI